MQTSRPGCTAFRVVVFREVLDSTGHQWHVPIWSTVQVAASSAEDALEQALSHFEDAWPCEYRSDAATHVEVEEISNPLVAGNELPASKRVVQVRA